MITIKNIQNTATVTDGSNTIELGAGGAYTCDVTEVNEWLELTIDTTISTSFSSNTEFRFLADRTWLSVDKGDGSDVLYYGKTAQSEKVILSYAVAGVYNVRIKGNGGIAFDSRFTDALKITEVKNFGTNLYFGVNTFFGLSNAVFSATDRIIIERAISGLPFYDCTLLESIAEPINIESTNQANTFRGSSLNADLGTWDMRPATSLSAFARSVTTWTTENYGNTLLGWLRWDDTTHAPATGWNLTTNVSFHGGNSTLVTGSEAALARDYLINTLNWTITDGGLT